MNKNKYLVIFTGVIVGLAALALTAAGNPANMGFCIACFLRDIAGSLGLHSAKRCSICARRSSALSSARRLPRLRARNSAHAPALRPLCALCWA